MNVICLEDEAFHELLDKVLERLMEQHQEKPTWISVEDAMALLNITSKTTLQKLKNEGHLKFSQPMK